MPRKQRTINNGLLTKEPCGYCHSRAHKGYLTVEIMKKHGCLKKQCSCFERFDDHPYFRERRLIKERRRIRKFIDGLYDRNCIGKDSYQRLCRELETNDIGKFVSFMKEIYGYEPVVKKQG